MQEFKVLFRVRCQDACCQPFNRISFCIFHQTSCCQVGSSSELYPRMLQTIISINVCFSNVFQRNYFTFFPYSNTPPPLPLPRLQKKSGLQTCRPSFWIYYPICFSLQHIAVHALSPLALWYWCNMLTQLLSFKYDVCHKEFEPKSAASSWNVTSSCLLSSHLATYMVNCACVLHHFMNFFEDIAHAYVKTLAYTTGTTSKHQRATWLELYPKAIVFLRIVAWHMRVSANLQHVWGYGVGCCDVVKNVAKNVFLIRILKIRF